MALKLKFKLIIVKENLKFSSSVALATFQYSRAIYSYQCPAQMQNISVTAESSIDQFWFRPSLASTNDLGCLKPRFEISLKHIRFTIKINIGKKQSKIIEKKKCVRNWW